MISMLFYMFDLYNIWEQRETLHLHFFTIKAYNLRNKPPSLILFEPYHHCEILVIQEYFTA